MMKRRPLGRTNLYVSAVGLGTSQLRLVTEQQAINTLKRGFELGINVIHTAPDYEGADNLVAQAIKESGRDVIVLSQGYGNMEHFEWLFESTCYRLGKQRLEMFGIACIEDREYLGENVWGRGGMVEFLLGKKRQGRLRGIYCSTHGRPEYIARLITSGVFDAIVLSYNMLGFHILSYCPQPPKTFENISRIEKEIFPLAACHGVGLIIMKPLAGGLMCKSKAFPQRERLTGDSVYLKAEDVLRTILMHREISCVIPGTASVEEAEENARAGYEAAALEPDCLDEIKKTVGLLKSSLCNRCGICEPLCSQSLPISWLFRDAYICNYPSATFETIDEKRYFNLHPDEQAVCSKCTQRTCHCPHGIDIPASLIHIHRQMLSLRAKGLLPDAGNRPAVLPSTGSIHAEIVTQDIPTALKTGERAICRLWLHNAGSQTWKAHRSDKNQPQVIRGLVKFGKFRKRISLRHDAEPGTRTHFVFDITAPKRPGQYLFRFFLISSSKRFLPNRSYRILGTRLSVLPLNSIKTTFGKKAIRYGVSYLEHNIPDRLSAKTFYGAWVRLINQSSQTWQRDHPKGESVDLILYCDGQAWGRQGMSRSEVRPGEEVTIHFPLRVPSEPGLHELIFDLVMQNVTTFKDQGVRTLKLTFHVDPPPVSRTIELFEQISQINPWVYQPTRGVFLSRDGQTYPLIVAKAQGCHLWDLEGRKYIDYIMGWGSALLGYAETRVQRAIAAAMDCGAVVPLPHPLEADVARMLTEDIPCAEKVVFAKNGSDVCTLAVRLARVFTGKNNILFSGYHGWQDWWVEQFGFRETGVPERNGRLIHRFKFNDFNDIKGLCQKYRGDVAAVILEPSGPVEGLQGPIQDVDHNFLEAVAMLVRQEGALLIYDEIMTGFRYQSGSVQNYTGVVPDLACFGKALGGGMPLSALVGRTDIFHRAMQYTKFGPTFNGEIYSLAAAKAALQIYRDEPVANSVWNYGIRLKQRINRVCTEIGIAAECIGPPFRMMLVFKKEDPERINLMRTLYQQELLKFGVITYNGIMIPSYAHNEHVLESTLDAIRKALEKVAVAERYNNFYRYLEIPLV